MKGNYGLKSKTYREMLSYEDIPKEEFNRMWRNTYRRVKRRIDSNFDPSYETRKAMFGEKSILDSFEKGKRYKKEEIEEITKSFSKELTLNRTDHFMKEFKNQIVNFNGQNRKLSTIQKWFKQGKISKDDYYKAIENFKKFNPRYSKHYLRGGRKRK